MIDGAAGARVVEFSLDGENVLLERSRHPQNYGSTFWTSPQSDWGWPPPASIDTDAYAADVTADSVTFQAESPSRHRLWVKKTFRVRGDGLVRIEYRIENRGAVRVSVAPWEVTRVERRGVSFFPRGDGARVEGTFPRLFSEERDGVVWVDSNDRIAEGRKLYEHGSEGFLAHATRDFVFVKRFESVPAHRAAPGEAQIEIFANPEPPYLELEQQGALTELAAGEALRWSVEWRLAHFPPGASPSVGDSRLAAFARGLARPGEP